MATISGPATGVLVLAFLALLVVGFALERAFREALRQRHPAVWASLGSPTLIWNNSLANNFSTQRYLWTSRYGALGDKHLSGVALALKLVSVAYLLAFALLVYYISQGQQPRP